MEFTKIISSPVFAGSAPDIGLKAQSAGDVTLKVSTPEFSWEIVLSTLKNSAGENLVTIRLRDILSSVTAAPSPSETDADAALPLLFVNLAASNSEGEQVSTDIPVAYGNLTGKSPADFIGQWLTSREQVSRTYTWARERLSLIFGPQLLRWSGQVTLKIKCKAYFLSGSPETFELASVSSSENTYYTADCSYARIAALAESESPLVAWDLSYTLTGTDADGEPASLESYPQRFLLGRQDERIREFIFVNCFGMEDRVFGEGISKRKVDGSSTTFIAGGQKMEVSNDSETVFEAFSGQLADRRSIFHWHDFLSSATRLLLRPTDASLTRIVIDSHDSETEDFSVGGINFSYRLSDRHSDYPGGLYGSIGDYDPTQQFGALWVDKDPAAVAPEEGDLFFLKHRLSEFPSFNVADELLFLVQSPLTDAWGAFSVGNLKLWIGKFIDNGAKSIRLNALADYETSEGGVIDPAALQNGSIPVWDAAAGAYRPVPASKLGDFIAGKPLYPLIFEKAGKEVYRYTPDVQKTVLDISDVASAKVLSNHISDASVHVTAAEREAWNLVASLFGVDSDGNVYVKGGKGFYGTSFVSARGSDPEAGTSGGGGLDEDALWDILTSPGTEKIDASHLPAITASMIEGLALASVAYAVISGTAGKVAHALTVKNDGGSSSASAKTFDGSAAVTVTIPTTLPASDVYAWAKAATKPSYTWGEIGGKPSVFTPAAHTHPLSDISDLHASWDALLKAAPSAYVTRWPAWGEVTGKPSSFTPAEHTHVKADITDFPTSWAWSAITGKPTTLAGYGITDGVNSVTASGGLSASVSGHKLTVGVASGYAVPTSAQIGAWNLVASLFGVDADGNVYVKGGKGFYGTSFVSARGSDPEAGQGGGTGVDMDAVWDALAAGTSEQINASHIPALNISKITGLQSALDGKLNNGSTTYDTAYARGFQINGTTYTLWAITNPGTIGPLFAPSSPGTNGYILQSTGDVPAWISRSALTQQLFSGYKGCELIPDNSDLNDYTTPGLYFCPANATVQTLANVPVTGAFSLEILQAAGVIQILREYGYSSNANEFTRRYYNGSWTTWVRAPRRNELYTKTEADGRYLKLSGGTVTGNIVFSGATKATSSIKMSTETSNYRVGVQWESTNEGTKLGEIGYWNTQQRIYLNALADEVTDVWTDAVGKYSLVVGKNLLTYNTHPLLHSTNYTHYTVTKTGGGASGTWSINISGNAASATNATNLAGVAGTKYLYHLRRTGYNIDTESTLNPRVLEINNPEGTPPTSNAWLQVLVWGSGDSGYGTQLANRYNDEGSLYFRNKVAGTWKPWRTLIDTSNYTNFTLNRDAIVSTLGVSGTDLVGWTYNGVARSRVTQAQLRTMLGLGSNAYTSTAYLPLTGGTLTGQLNGVGANFNTQNGGTPFVISRVGLKKEAVSISVDDTVTRFDVTNDETSANLMFSLSATDTESGGGAAAKTGYVNDILNSDTIYTRYGYGASQRFRIGWNPNDGAYIENFTAGKWISITDTGSLMYNSDKIWHSGNDGSGSGLDADLLDGTQKSGLLTSVASTAAANLSVTVGGTTKSVADLYATYLDGYINYTTITVGGDADTYYPVVIQGPSVFYPALLLNITRAYNETAPDSWNTSTHKGGLTLCILWNSSKVWDGNGSGVTGTTNVLMLRETYCTMVGGMISSTSGLVVWLRGGTATYHIYSDRGVRNIATVYLNGFTDSQPKTFSPTKTPSSISAYQRLSVTASAASKLATARTLWGKPFDGSGNVSGDMTGVGSITMTGPLSLTRTGSVGLLIDNSLRNLSWTVDTSERWARALRATDPTGSTTLINAVGVYGGAQTPKYVYLGGTDALSPSMVVTAAGNVGIGTTSPSFKLSVDGTSYFTGLLTAYSGLATSQYVQVGSGRLKWDAANNALYVEKSDGTPCGLYSKGYMSARGSDPEASTGGSSELVPEVYTSKLTVGTNVSISVLDNAGLTADVREKMCDGTIGRVKAVFSNGSTEIWPVLHASNDFISFGYDTVLGGYQDTMNIYEITIPSKTTVIRVEHFER